MVVTLALVGYVITSQLVAHHPLHGMLSAYDREIAALRSTQRVAGLRDPAGAIGNAASAARADASVAAARTDAIGSHAAGMTVARERTAAAAVLRAQRAPERSFATYASQLTAETNANLQAYGGALTQRTERAYAARAQQFREKESTLAFDLARQNAGKRLTLRVKLTGLHLAPARRARLRAQLASLDASERRAVDTMRRRDAAELAVYRSQLESTAAAGAGAMDAQLRAKAGANYAILRQVFNEAASTAGALPQPAQLVAFTNGYSARHDVRNISSGMRAAAADLTQRFERLSAVDSQSRRDVASQLQALQGARTALYRTMLGQIETAAQTIARERHLAAVKLLGVAPKGAYVNLTQAVEARVASHDLHS